MNNELKKSLEMRQENLIFLLKNKKEELELEKQHQIYGAIKEIDYILRMLKVTEEDEQVSEIQTVEGESMPRKAIKVEEKQKNFKIPIRIKFQKDQM